MGSGTGTETEITPRLCAQRNAPPSVSFRMVFINTAQASEGSSRTCCAVSVSAVCDVLDGGDYCAPRTARWPSPPRTTTPPPPPQRVSCAGRGVRVVHVRVCAWGDVGRGGRGESHGERQKTHVGVCFGGGAAALALRLHSLVAQQRWLSPWTVVAAAGAVGAAIAVSKTFLSWRHLTFASPARRRLLDVRVAVRLPYTSGVWGHIRPRNYKFPLRS